MSIDRELLSTYIKDPKYIVLTKIEPILDLNIFVPGDGEIFPLGMNSPVYNASEEFKDLMEEHTEVHLRSYYISYYNWLAGKRNKYLRPWLERNLSAPVALSVIKELGI